MANFIRPNPISYDAIDLSWIVGRFVLDVSFCQPQWQFSLGATERIAVECLWRIVQKEQIVLTNRDHGQSFGRSSPVDAVRNAMNLLSVVQITNAQLRNGTADIQITF